MGNTETQLKLIAALAEAAAIKVRNHNYWEGELQRDVARIRDALRDLESSIERR